MTTLKLRMCSTNHNRPSSIRSDTNESEGLNSGEVTPKLSPSIQSTELPHPFYDYKEEKAHLHVSNLNYNFHVLSSFLNQNRF